MAYLVAAIVMNLSVREGHSSTARIVRTKLTLDHIQYTAD